MAGKSSLKRKVYPQDVAHGAGGSSSAGKWAALAFAVLAGVLIWGTLRVTGYFEYDALEIGGESELRTELRDGVCDLTLDVPIRNTELSMVVVTNGSLRYEGVVKRFHLGEAIRGGETVNLTIDLVIGRCEEQTWTAEGQRLWLEYERVGEANNNRYHARLALGDWTPDAPATNEAPAEDDPERSVIVR